MTDNRETIEMLKILKEQALKSHNDTAVLEVKIDSFNFVLDEAIKALEQQPCDDCISREQAKDAMYALCDDTGTLKDNPWRDNPHIDAITDVLDNLPSVTPKHQPCGDAVSRQSVLDTLDKMDKALDTDRTVENYKGLLTECYKDLPPVATEEKIGHWIPLGNYDEWGNENSYRCSKCGERNFYPDNYCHNCGARMVESQEGEGK